MVRLTDSELDCVMNAARPLDVSARGAFLREVASALASCPAIGDGVVHRVVAEIQHRHFRPPEFGDGEARRRVASTAELVHLAGIAAVFAG
jgi:hypothetical protein